MRKRLVIAGVSFVAFVLFFFLVPIVGIDQMPCNDFSMHPGYSSISYHFFKVGLAYLQGYYHPYYFGPIPQGLIDCW